MPIKIPDGLPPAHIIHEENERKKKQEEEERKRDEDRPRIYPPEENPEETPHPNENPDGDDGTVIIIPGSNEQ